MKVYLFVIILLIIIFIFPLILKLLKNIKIQIKLHFLNLNNYMKDDILLPKYQNNMKINDKNIPKIIYQTYNNKNKVPSIVFENIKKYANSYEYKFYNDDDCINFLKTYFEPKILNKFNSMKKGAHKADLFRYCILYLYGGYYIDIKSILIKPLDQVFKNNYDLYTVIGGIGNKAIYQGILATYPRNDIIKRSINFILETSNDEIDNLYSIFIQFLYRDISKSSISKNIKEGENKLKNSDTIYLFKEECCDKNCPDKPKDRYGRYCVIKDKDEVVFETRFQSFPW